MTRLTNQMMRALSIPVITGFFLALLFLWTAPVLKAQTSGTGSIEGTVTDSTGAVLPGATITATNSDTGVKTTAVSTGAGRYVISLLLPGTYNVAVTASGFSTLSQQHIVVVALAALALDAKLSPGSTTESVVVTDEPPTLQTEDLKLGSSINNEVYDSLPLAQNQAARDPSAFIGSAVGVNSFSVQAAGPSTASFNGGQTFQNETYVEGLPMTSAGTESDTRNLAFGISVEAVEQFQVAVTGSESTYEGQGVSNFIVKSGTNKFHGGVYEFFRNTIFDSKSFFSSAASVEHQNEFGGSISGPALKNKLFFFANYDGYRFDSATPPTPQSIPTAAEQIGNFSAFPNPIYDPNTCLATSTTGACTSRAQFACAGVLNVICPSRLSTAAKSLQSYLPTTNYDGSPLGTGISGNYVASLPNLVNNDSGTAKVDYDLSSRNRISGIFSKGKYANPLVGSLSAASLTANSTLPIPYTDGRGVIEYATLAQVHDSFVIRPNLINDFGYGLSRLFIPLTSNTASGNYPSAAKLTGLPPGIASTGFPDISFTGNNVPVSWDGTNSHAFNETQTTFTLQDNILWTKGKHQVTFGYQWQALQDNENTPLTGTQAGFTFGPNETSNFTSSGAIDTTTGLAYASYLLGAVDSSTVTQNAVIETGGRYRTNAVYVQDNVQLTPSLTINVGLRWDIWSPFKESEDRMTFFNPNIANPVAGGILGGLQFAGVGPDSCGCRTPVLTHYHEFGPRVGLAYKVNNTTVIRAAYDIFYAHAGGVGGRTNGRQGLSQIGFNSSGSLGSTVTGQPAYFWDGGIPGNPINPPFFNPSYGIGFILSTQPGAAAIGAGPSTAQTLSYGDPQRGAQAPQYQDFFFNIQHSFGRNTTLSVAYSGSVGRYLPGAGVAGQFTDQIPVQYLPLTSLLTQTLSTTTIASAKNLGFTVVSPFPGFTGTIGQALKPYPQYSSISNPWLDVGSSSYNSLQTTLNRRIANGLSFMVNYTFSKEMDDLAGVRLPGADYLENSVGALDRKHVLQSTVIYKLPFGTGQKFSSGNAIVNGIVGNWQLSGIFFAATGAPLSVGGTCTGGGIIDASCYPNYVPGVSAKISGKPVTQVQAKATPYINISAFANPAVYTYGNAARTAPDGLFAPTTTNIDASVRREFPLFESLKFTLQCDAFNVLNKVYFGSPNTTLSSTSFGTYTTQGNLPRKYQFSARITF
jgi:Carboxypeptidase regulatory-like domain/TonB dependent receptor